MYFLTALCILIVPEFCLPFSPKNKRVDLLSYVLHQTSFCSCILTLSCMGQIRSFYLFLCVVKKLNMRHLSQYYRKVYVKCMKLAKANLILAQPTTNSTCSFNKLFVTALCPFTYYCYYWQRRE